MNRERLDNVFRHIRDLVHVQPGKTPAVELLDRFVARHDEADFAALLECFGPLVWSVCVRVTGDEHDAADAFQSTFLVLATKAGSVRNQRAIGSWLYGVAYRVARKIQRSADRRCAHERQVRTMPSTDPAVEVSWREVCSVLDEALHDLPEKYRTPLVLCYLEGKTNEQAARELGWPVGSMSRHLTRGRELLRGQLCRRGVTLSGPLLATVLVENACTAMVPATVNRETIHAAAAFVAGQGNAIAPAVLQATHAVLRGMAWRPLHLVAGLVLALGTAAALLVGSVYWTDATDSAPPSTRAAADVPPSDRKASEPAKEAVAPRPLALADWPLYRGNASRTGQGIGGVFAPQPAWRVSTVLPPESGEGVARVWAEDMINNGIRQLEQRAGPALPAFQPLVISDQLIYRTYSGIYAAYLKDVDIEITVGGEKIREKKKPGDYAWWSNTDGGVLSLIRDPNKKGVIDSWRAQYNQWGGANVIFENSLTGTLSSDGVRLFVVDDLVVQPHPQILLQIKEGKLNEPNWGSLEKQAKRRNMLKAFHIERGGPLLWELGGDHDPSDKTQDSFFLGPPLPLNGKLFVLNEKDGIVRLICLEPKDGTEKDAKPPEILWIEELTKMPNPIALDFPRRLHAAHVACSEGILVCPTNAGAIFGVDLIARRLAWKYQYDIAKPDDKKPKRPFDPGSRVDNHLADRWKVTAPAIVDGTVIFAAPDGTTLEGLDLRTGKMRWKSNRATGDLYFAGVFDGLALVVSRGHCRALRLKDGTEVWRLENTGVPSGQGVAAAGIYYLPLGSGAESKEPEILAIHITKGTIARRTAIEKQNGKREVPGNLIFVNGQMVSQSLATIALFPPVKE